MKKSVIGLLGLGVALGMIGNQVLNAQMEQVKRTDLLKTDLPGIEGKEVLIRHVEFAPGAASMKHYHPGNVLHYVLEGSAIFEVEGKPAVTFKAGDTWHEPPNKVHVMSASKTAPLKVLVILITEKGKPFVVPVK